MIDPVKDIDGALEQYSQKFINEISKKPIAGTNVDAFCQKENNNGLKEDVTTKEETKQEVQDKMRAIREKLKAKYSEEEIKHQAESSNKIEMLKKIGNIKRCAKGQTFFDEGDAGDCMYIILHGFVDIYIRKLGKKVKVARLKERDFFGEMSLLEKMPRSAAAVAYTDILVLEIKEENFLKFIQYEPEISFNLMKALSSRVRKLNDQIKN